jgi:adenine-specific DNA methylase
MKSSKPTRDKAKVANGVPDAVPALRRHLRKMERANADFWEQLPRHFKRDDRAGADIRCADARSLPWEAESVDLVVTSPPYVTSYEYADLHELTALWFTGIEDLAVSKKTFIGSAAARGRDTAEASSELGKQITAELRQRKPAKAEEARQYFLDMEAVFSECGRLLASGGTLCDVIGNTSLERVEILNAEVHAEILAGLGFELCDVIHRVIPLKTLPQIRDPKTGKFTSRGKGKLVEAYPEEFIVVARKP